MSAPAEMLSSRGVPVSLRSERIAASAALYPGAEKLLWRHVTPIAFALGPRLHLDDLLIARALHPVQRRTK
jgi:hypothetical protein